MRFFIEQLAIAPPDPQRAKALLAKMGWTEWTEDRVTAHGGVRDAVDVTNVARLSFNYQTQRGTQLEFEVLHYESGANWMASRGPSASHLGMHCTAEELDGWRDFFAKEGVGIAQEVRTSSHENPLIAGKRWYQYVIFDTRPILGIDLKFIVRLQEPPKKKGGAGREYALRLARSVIATPEGDWTQNTITLAKALLERDQ